MTQGIYTKWIVGAAFILLIIAAGCIWYYHHSTAHHKEQTAEDDKVLQHWKAKKHKRTIPAETESTQTPAENTTSTATKRTTDDEVTTTEADMPKMSKFDSVPCLIFQWIGTHLIYGKTATI